MILCSELVFARYGFGCNFCFASPETSYTQNCTVRAARMGRSGTRPEPVSYLEGVKFHTFQWSRVRPGPILATWGVKWSRTKGSPEVLYPGVLTVTTWIITAWNGHMSAVPTSSALFAFVDDFLLIPYYLLRSMDFRLWQARICPHLRFVASSLLEKRQWLSECLSLEDYCESRKQVCHTGLEARPKHESRSYRSEMWVVEPTRQEPWV